MFSVCQLDCVVAAVSVGGNADCECGSCSEGGDDSC